jgi:hypothetical protein
VGFSRYLYALGGTRLETIEFLKQENNRLRGLVGNWRRQAQEKAPRRECVREGYSVINDYSGLHYKVYAVRNIPQDLPIEEVLKEIRKDFMPGVVPYRLKRVDYSQKYDGWLVEVQNEMILNNEF